MALIHSVEVAASIYQAKEGGISGSCVIVVAGAWILRMLQLSDTS
jgi:hypothetical protein